MQQSVDGERVEIARIDLFLLAEDSGGEATNRYLAGIIGPTGEIVRLGSLANGAG